ncbi:TPA: putative phage tail protein, partial [Serratia marcescens]
MTITPHQQAFLQLLPNGLAWDKRPDAPLSDLSLALSTSMGAADAIGDQLLAERFPNNATLLLEDWERFLGLPDCAGEDATIETRQIAA